MIKWEYCTMRLLIVTLDNISIMNSFGKDGWKLVAIADYIAYFKRSISKERRDMGDEGGYGTMSEDD